MEPTEDQIRAAYTLPYQPGAINRLAKACGIHRNSVSYRAKKLGLSLPPQPRYVRQYRKNWTPGEIKIIRDNPTMRNENLYDLLKKHGCQRSIEAVRLKRAKMGWLDHLERDVDEVGYTAHGLSELLGVTAMAVNRWIQAGLLKAKQEGGPGINHRYRVQRRHLREFLINYLDRWEPGKVDKYWLMDVLIHP